MENSTKEVLQPMIDKALQKIKEEAEPNEKEKMSEATAAWVNQKKSGGLGGKSLEPKEPEKLKAPGHLGGKEI